MERCSVRRLGGGGDGVEEPRGGRHSATRRFRARKATTTRVAAAGAIHGCRVRAFLCRSSPPWSQRMRAYAAARRRAARLRVSSLDPSGSTTLPASRQQGVHRTPLQSGPGVSMRRQQCRLSRSTPPYRLGVGGGAQRQRERRRTGLAVWDGEGLVMLRPQARACM